MGADIRGQGGELLGQKIPHVGAQIGTRGSFGHHRKAETITGRGRFGETEQRFIRRQPPQAAARQHVSAQSCVPIMFAAGHIAALPQPTREQVQAVFRRHADGAVQLVRQRRDYAGRFAGAGLACRHHRPVFTRQPQSGQPDRRAGCSGFGRHLRQAVLHRLVLRQRLAELLARLGPIQGQRQHGFGEAGDLGAGQRRRP